MDLIHVVMTAKCMQDTATPADIWVGISMHGFSPVSGNECVSFVLGDICPVTTHSIRNVLAKALSKLSALPGNRVLFKVGLLFHVKF